MGLMARVAGDAAGVICRYDLGEGFRLGAIGFVATGADHCAVEFRRGHIGRIVRVLGLGAVAGFTGENNVAAEFFLVGHIGVAAFADFAAGNGYRPGGNFGDGSSAIVSVLTEALGDNSSPKNDEQ